MSAIPPGDYFVLQDFFSPARFNRKTATHLPGDSIVTLSPTYPNQKVVCTADSTGANAGVFLLDTEYRRNTANTQWLTSTGGKHTHAADTDIEGGLASGIFYANAAKLVYIPHNTVSKGSFMENASTGTSTDDTTNGRLNLSSGSGNGNYINVQRPGPRIDFGIKSRWIWKGYVTEGNNLSARAGVNMENVNAATDNAAKYGLEVCESAGTLKQWEIISANVTARSPLATVQDVKQSGPLYYRLDYTVAQDVRLFINGSQVNIKSTNVPTTSQFSDGIENVSFGIRNNNSAVAKSLFIYTFAFAGQADSGNQ